jgi:glycosyltransferase involved in cell wall biosynthesis
MLPAISICLTAYKRADMIGHTIESLLAQSFGDFELIIADDASPDDTEEVCRRFEKEDSRVRYIRQKQNVGMPYNLNSAIDLARAPLIANLHDGDIYDKNLLRSWKSALDRQLDAAFVFNAYARLDASGQHVGVMSRGLPERFERFELIRYMLQRGRCLSSPVWGTVMGRLKCYRQVGGFDPRFGFVSDVALWLRLNALFAVAYVPETLITLHQGENDRPAAFVNWQLEQALVDMYREAAEALDAGGANHDVVGITLRRAQERRWLAHLGSCFRHERYDRAAQGIEAFLKQDSALLRRSAFLAKYALRLAERSRFTRRLIASSASIYHTLRRSTSSRKRAS